MTKQSYRTPAVKTVHAGGAPAARCQFEAPPMIPNLPGTAYS